MTSVIRNSIDSTGKHPNDKIGDKENYLKHMMVMNIPLNLLEWERQMIIWLSTEHQAMEKKRKSLIYWILVKFAGNIRKQRVSLKWVCLIVTDTLQLVLIFLMMSIKLISLGIQWLECFWMIAWQIVIM